MKIIENHLLFEYFLLTVCGLCVTQGHVSPKPSTIWGNQNDHDDKPDQRMENRSKRSLLECGVHGQEPTIDSLSTDTTVPGEWPWVVALVRSRGKEFTYQCGASLIDNRFAITAAHCIYNQFDQKQMETEDFAIIVGVRDVSRRTYDADSIRFLTAMYIHEEYGSGTNRNNIALLVLKEPVTHYKLVKSVCLWEGEDDHNDLEKAINHGTVVGWGEIDRVIALEVPHRFNMSIISFTTCRELNMENADLINEKTFCAVKQGTKTICRGFSGAGLYIEQHGRWMLRGVVSTGLLTEGTCGSTAVYTDVANYRNWISDGVYRWSQTNILPTAPTTHAGYNLAWTQQCPMRDDVNSLLVGGEITREGEWPWHVAIYHNEHKLNSSSISYKCGGSLISASHVLTAAHCVINKLINRPIPKTNINIILGTHNIKSFSSGLQFKLVDRLEIHPEYNTQRPYKDIAVLKLSSPVEFTGVVRPVCLWPEDKVDLSHVVNKNGSVVGWGYDEYGLLAEELKLTKLSVVSELTCVRSDLFYYKYANNFTYCAGLFREKSACNGDSGGGMVFKLRSGAGTEGWFLRGLVSLRRLTDTPCDTSHFVIFTDVAKHLDWIKNAVSRDMALK